MSPPSARLVSEIAADPDRAAAYARLLYLQRGYAEDPSAAADLAAELPSTLLPLLIRDAADPDESVAASALKCLGFALYHPVLVSTISGSNPFLMLSHMICCLHGIFALKKDQAASLLTAIVHAVDNPFGSLSTTFEAAQAIMKLAGQSPKRMRDLSSLWVPPIYRRLLSADKPERDMAERCLVKVSGILLPPQPLLSKIIASDLEQQLLSCMMNMLGDPLKKVQAVKSWGWIIFLLGSSAVSNRRLLNKLLKVPERMFIDLDPQVQLAAMASWKHLVDAFFPTQAAGTAAQETVVSLSVLREYASAQVKRIKLIMVPLCRVLSRSRSLALCCSCLSTWHYLLHKLAQIWRFLVQGIATELKLQLVYEQVSECLTQMCKFVKRFFLDHVGKHNSNRSAILLQFGLQLANVIVEELDHSLLASEKFEICLDIEHIKVKQYAEWSQKLSCPVIRVLSYKEVVSPAVYMTVISLSMIAQFTGELSHDVAEKLALILSSPDSLENFHAAVSFMYMQIRCPEIDRTNVKWLLVWNKLAKHLNRQNDYWLEISLRLSSRDVLYQFFCYPLFALSYPGPQSVHPNSENSSDIYAPVTQNLEVELALEVYRSLSINSFCGSKVASMVFLEGFYEYLVTIIDENMSGFQSNLEHSEKFQSTAILSTLGEVLIGSLQNIRLLNSANQELDRTNEDSTGCIQPNLSVSSLKIINRFMKLSSFGFKTNPTGQNHVTNRVLTSLSTFVGNLMLKKDILLLVEIVGDQLTEWLSLSGMYYYEMQQGETIYQLERLWITIVEGLKMSQLITDGSFFQHQKLLQVALNHPHHPISAATASIWRPATHGNSSLQHPGCLVSKLDELLRRRPKDFDKSGDANKTVHEGIDVSRASALPMPEKKTIASNESEHNELDGGSLNISVGLGRKRLKISKYPTKPKELGKNAAQLGGPSPRRDTGVFSPCCMESKVCRKPELIVEMLKRKR
ncbi:hypothetical protein EJB05_57699 [Eragrostis curvula]|uniref:Telomere-associated protein Rif1 N-terminal domain-containing protein n=1 Tax=Eragrostis curvula TaxID=38414 RepID=A0A5J9SCS2_9POAL|nr:hypothetical protein EJB05_57699 [Eragrostis curvula]